MSWQHWILFVAFSFAAISTVQSIGKPRQPITPGLAVGVMIYSGILLLLLITGQRR